MEAPYFHTHYYFEAMSLSSFTVVKPRPHSVSTRIIMHEVTIMVIVQDTLTGESEVIADPLFLR